MSSTNENVGLVLMLVAGAGIWILTSFLIASAAAKKGHNYWAFLALGLLISPVISAIVYLVVPDKREQADAASRKAQSADLDDLVKLASLRDSGVLTEEEFEAEKARILAARRAPDESLAG